MARLPVADDGQLEEQLDERYRAENEGGPLLGCERLRQVESGRISQVAIDIADVDVDVVVVKVGVVASNLRREVFEEDGGQAEGLRAEGYRQHAEALLSLRQVDPAAALASGFPGSTC